MRVVHGTRALVYREGGDENGEVPVEKALPELQGYIAVRFKLRRVELLEDHRGVKDDHRVARSAIAAASR